MSAESSENSSCRTGVGSWPATWPQACPTGISHKASQSSWRATYLGLSQCIIWQLPALLHAAAASTRDRAGRRVFHFHKQCLSANTDPTLTSSPYLADCRLTNPSVYVQDWMSSVRAGEWWGGAGGRRVGCVQTPACAGPRRDKTCAVDTSTRLAYAAARALASERLVWRQGRDRVPRSGPSHLESLAEGATGSNCSLIQDAYTTVLSSQPPGTP